jgi:hypothetical protein
MTAPFIPEHILIPGQKFSRAKDAITTDAIGLATTRTRRAVDPL